MAIHASVQAHNAGYWIFLSSVAIAVVTVLHTYTTFDHLVRRDDPALVLRIINILSILGTLFSSLLIPRRPAVFFRGEPVDAQWTCSILSRYTWTWVWPLIRLAGKKGDLDEKDVPQPDHTVRVEEVLKDWHGYAFRGSLIWQLLHVYKARLALQWTVTMVRCVIGAAPYWVMLRLINILEQRGGGGSPGRDLWGLVILLGVLALIEQVCFLRISVLVTCISSIQANGCA